MFVRVRLPIGKPHSALLVIDRAIGSDQGLKFVYVVDADNKVQQRRIETGPLQEDGLRVITSGLKPDEWVVVGGVQQVRPRMEIVRDQEPMPTLGGSVQSTSPTGEQSDAKLPAGVGKGQPSEAGKGSAAKEVEGELNRKRRSVGNEISEPGPSKPTGSVER